MSTIVRDSVGTMRCRAVRYDLLYRLVTYLYSEDVTVSWIQNI